MRNNNSNRQLQPSAFEYAPLSKALILTTGTLSIIRIKFNSVFQQAAAAATTTAATAAVSSSSSLALGSPSSSKAWALWITDGLSHPIAFSSPITMIVGLCLLTNFRQFERTHGFRKFLSTILLTIVCSSVLHTVLLRAKLVDVVPSGPYAVLFAFLVHFWFDVPDVIGGFKAGVYLLAGMLLASEEGSVVAATIGVLIGLLRYHPRGSSSVWATWMLPETWIHKIHVYLPFTACPKPHVKIARHLSQRIGQQQQLLESFNRQRLR